MTRPDRKLARASAPAVEPISLSDAKTYLRVDGSAEDTLITDMIKAVRLAAEETMGASLVTQGRKITFAGGICDRVPLPFGPVQSVTSVTVFDEAGDDTIISATAYHLDPAGDRLVLESAISGHRIEVVYVAGFGNAASDVPMDIRHGMMSHLLMLYETRNAINPPEVAMRAYGPHIAIRL